MKAILLILLVAPLFAQHEGPLDLEDQPPQKRSEKPGAVAPRPYDFKGDWVGMSLSVFRSTHRRVTTGNPHDADAPWCSDTSPEATNLADPRDLAKGLVRCRLYYPYEIGRPNFQPDTIANYPADIYYRFIDGQLYEISATFAQHNFADVKEGFITKFGKPAANGIATYQNAYGAKYEGEKLSWDNGVSSILLLERSGNLDRSSATFIHNPLYDRARQRERPKATNGPDL